MQMMQEKSRHLRTMARYLDVSDRTVYRYFDLFKALGYQVNKDKFNKFYLTK
jgi:predicted DNA-binding transcriptional regulator YafY